MSERLAQTRDMLAKHHRDGERFVQLMRETFADRFNGAFWDAWGQWVEPVLSDPPVVLDTGVLREGRYARVVGERRP